MPSKLIQFVAFVAGAVAAVISVSPAAARKAEYYSRSDLSTEAAVEASRTLSEIASSGADARRALSAAAASLGREHVVTQSLLAPVLADESATREQLQEVAKKAADALTFRPTKEADTPPGFPDFTPVHCIEVKRYPAYRMASTEIGFLQNGAFWQLFQHISRNEIAMTAPVQMDHVEADADSPRRMSFLYGSAEIGSVGTDPQNKDVRIIDFPPLTVVSIGLRGRQSQQRFAAAQEQLESWLKANAARFVPAGPARQMGFNSPMLRGEDQYWEIEIPVKEVKTARPSPS